MARDAELTIVQLNDVHGYLDLHHELFWGPAGATYRPAGGYARIATIIGEIRRERPGGVLLLDCGDTIHGTRPVVESQGRAVVPMVNQLGIDAMTAHWEFAYGPAVLRERVAEIDHPLLAANIYDKETGARPYPTHIVREVAGLRVAVIGLASNIVDTMMPPHFSEGLRFTDGRAELADLVAAIREAERPDLVVLLSHLGFPQDLQLLAETAGVDVCVSGHTHNRLWSPVRQGEALVIQSGCHGSFVGRLDLRVEAGRVVDARHALIEVAEEITPDPDVAALVVEVLDHYPDRDEVVGETATALDRGTTIEATMDNFLLQALLQQTDARVAFSNGWRYGAPIPVGPVTVNDLYNIVPMNPPVSTVSLTGDEIWTMIAENLQHTFARDPFQQMGGYVKRVMGARVYMKVENPAGQRVQHIFIGDERLRPDRRYQAAFVTAQGVPPDIGEDREEHAERAIDAMRAYLAVHRPADAGLRETFVQI